MATRRVPASPPTPAISGSRGTVPSTLTIRTSYFQYAIVPARLEVSSSAITSKGHQKFVEVSLIERDALKVEYQFSSKKVTDGAVVVSATVNGTGLGTISKAIVRCERTDIPGTKSLVFQTFGAHTNHEQSPDPESKVIVGYVDLDSLEKLPSTTPIRFAVVLTGHLGHSVTTYSEPLTRGDLPRSPSDITGFEYGTIDTSGTPRLKPVSKIAAQGSGPVAEAISPPIIHHGCDEVVNTNVHGVGTQGIVPGTSTTSFVYPCTMFNPGLIIESAKVYSDACYGIHFASAISGYLHGILFYRTPQDTAEHIATLWDVETGSVITELLIPQCEYDTARWQRVNFIKPTDITLMAKAEYILSYRVQAHQHHTYYRPDPRFGPLRYLGWVNSASSGQEMPKPQSSPSASGIDIIFDIDDEAKPLGPVVRTNFGAQVVPRCAPLELSGTASISQKQRDQWSISQVWDSTGAGHKGVISGSLVKRTDEYVLTYSLTAKVSACSYPKLINYRVYSRDVVVAESHLELNPQQLSITVQGTKKLDTPTDDDPIRIVVGIPHQIFSLSTGLAEAPDETEDREIKIVPVKVPEFNQPIVDLQLEGGRVISGEQDSARLKSGIELAKTNESFEYTIGTDSGLKRSVLTLKIGNYNTSSSSLSF